VSRQTAFEDGAINYVKVTANRMASERKDEGERRDRKYEINHIYMQKSVLHIMQRTMIFIFLNKYFIISTIIWCYAV
jgi:hypothetical protein